MTELQSTTLNPEIAPQAFAEMRAKGDAPLLLDVREPWEFEYVHLPDAVAMPMGDVPSRAHAELDPDAPIVVMCHHGARSLSVAMWLRGQGFEQVWSLAGGIDGWSRVVDATVARY
ncbi:MAG: rhodanese-like domain-containing protein [Acidobacteriaceae bacterium]|jgi:rhodanese-related sulfurtransferase